MLSAVFLGLVMGRHRKGLNPYEYILTVTKPASGQGERDNKKQYWMCIMCEKKWEFKNTTRFANHVRDHMSDSPELETRLRESVQARQSRPNLATGLSSSKSAVAANHRDAALGSTSSSTGVQRPETPKVSKRSSCSLSTPLTGEKVSPLTKKNRGDDEEPG